MSGQVLTIAQQKGGSGKTTLAVNIAVELLARGHSVALLDTDPQGSLGRWFMARLEATDGTPGLEFGTASAWGVGYEVEKLRKLADFVLIDTPPKIDSDLRPALRESDLVLVPVAVSQMDLWATESVMEMAERVEKPVMLIMNRQSARARLTADVSACLDAFNAPRAQTGIGARVVFAEVIGEGKGVSEKAPRSLARREISALTDEVLAQLGA